MEMEGDPSPDETIDYDRELLTVGWVDLILGLAGLGLCLRVVAISPFRQAALSPSTGWEAPSSSEWMAAPASLRDPRCGFFD